MGASRVVYRTLISICTMDVALRAMHAHLTRSPKQVQNLVVAAADQNLNELNSRSKAQ